MTFEDQFMAIQEGIVALAFEYVHNNTDDIERIFIYGVSENYLTIHFGYQVGESVVDINDLNSVLPASKQVYEDLLSQLLRLGVGDLKQLTNYCKEHGKDHPTELWMIYDTQNQSFKTKYSYDWRYDKDETLELNSREEFEAWLEELSKGQGDW